jgi:hypothetical protein
MTAPFLEENMSNEKPIIENNHNHFAAQKTAPPQWCTFE